MVRHVAPLIGLAWALVAPAGAQVVQSTRGATEQFGPGFTALSDTRVEFRLARPAHAVVLWVTPAGAVQLHYPLRSRDRTERKAGRHAVDASEVPSPIESPVITGTPSSGRTGYFTPMGTGLMTGKTPAGEETVSGYWVLVLTERPLPAAEVKDRLSMLSREGEAAAVLDRIALLLLPPDGGGAMYVAGVIVAR